MLIPHKNCVLHERGSLFMRGLWSETSNLPYRFSLIFCCRRLSGLHHKVETRRCSSPKDSGASQRCVMRERDNIFLLGTRRNDWVQPGLSYSLSHVCLDPSSIRTWCSSRSAGSFPHRLLPGQNLLHDAWFGLHGSGFNMCFPKLCLI